MFNVGGTARRRARWALRRAPLARLLVLALSLSLATSGALPLWALLFGVEGPHVCHCSVEKHDCVCARCNPDQQDALMITGETLTGQCGDDEMAFPGKAILAVLASPCAAAPRVGRRLPAPAAAPRPDLLAARAPPVPPPRTSTPSSMV